MLKQMGITADNLELGVEFEDVIGFLTGALPASKKGGMVTIYLKLLRAYPKNIDFLRFPI